MNRARLTGAIVIAFLFAAAAASVIVSRGDHTVRGSASRIAAQATVKGGHGRRLGALHRGQIGFALTLRLQQRRLDGYLQNVSPGSGSRPALTASQFGARFGETPGQLAQLRAVLNREGITVRSVYPQRTAMLASAGVDRLHTVFGLHFNRFETAAGQPYFAPDRAPRIPAELAPYVSGLGDLSNAPVPSDDLPAGGLTPKVTATAFDIAPLWARGDDGKGQTIAVASAFGAINPADLQAYARHNGVPVPQVQIKTVNGGSRYSAQTGSDGEVDLDLQVVAGVAPDARIIDYQGSQDSSLGHSLGDIYNTIEQDGQAKVVTTSYGTCEAVLAAQNPGDQQLIDNSLKALDASGVTVFVATGDTGANACLQVAQIQPTTTLNSVIAGLSVQAPASSPYAVAVGGTTLDLRSDGSYLSESAWSNALEREGTGGGISALEPRPVWQQGPGVSTAAPNPQNHRQIPDVVGPADALNGGYSICSTAGGQSTPECASGNGGTSAAAPFWAASMLLVQQYAAQHGAGKLATCFAAPILYDLAATHQPVPPFHQITNGTNGYYRATPGWNYATGLGSPDVFNLAQDYASFLHNRSSRTCPF
jgi:subtilase family serine protease